MLMPRITILAFLLLLSLSCFSQRWLLSVDFSMGAETRFLASQLFDDWTNRGRSNYFHLSAQSQLSDRLYLGLVGGLTQRSYRQENTRPLISGITRLEYEVFRERALDLGLGGTFLLWRGNTTVYLRMQGLVNTQLKVVTIRRDWNIGTSYKAKYKSKRSAGLPNYYFTGQVGLGNRWPLQGAWALGLEVNTWYRTLENPSDFFRDDIVPRHGWRVGGQVSIFCML